MLISNCQDIAILDYFSGLLGAGVAVLRYKGRYTDWLIWSWERKFCNILSCCWWCTWHLVQGTTMERQMIMLCMFPFRIHLSTCSQMTSMVQLVWQGNLWRRWDIWNMFASISLVKSGHTSSWYLQDMTMYINSKVLLISSFFVSREESWEGRRQLD